MTTPAPIREFTAGMLQVHKRTLPAIGDTDLLERAAAAEQIQVPLVVDIDNSGGGSPLVKEFYLFRERADWDLLAVEAIASVADTDGNSFKVKSGTQELVAATTIDIADADTVVPGVVAIARPSDVTKAVLVEVTVATGGTLTGLFQLRYVRRALADINRV